MGVRTLLVHDWCYERRVQRQQASPSRLFGDRDRPKRTKTIALVVLVLPSRTRNIRRKLHATHRVRCGPQNSAGVPKQLPTLHPYTLHPYTPVNPLRMLAFDASGRAALFLFYRPARGADMGGLRDHRASSEAGRRTMEEPSAKRHRVRRPFNSPPCHCVCSTPPAYLLFLPVLLLEEKRILDCSAPLVVAAAHAQLHLLRPTSGQGAHRVRLPCRAPLPKHTLTTHTHALRVEV